MMFFTSNTPVIFLASLYLATLAIGGDGVITGSVTADVFDYQQWKTGKRLEGFITQFSGMIVTAASMVCALINPWFYERFGLTTDYSVLYEENIRNSIFGVLIITSLISTVLCTVPMLFYNMNEKKMGEIVTELKNRAQGE
jgi:Na+/melibiose symporter-like transporter